jgi:hypothetical protein
MTTDYDDDEPVDEAHGWVQLTPEQDARFQNDGRGEDAAIALVVVGCICYETATVDGRIWMRRDD